MPKIRAESIEAHKKLTRDALLDAATKSFVAHGFAGSSLSSIADLAGIARTTLYDYFESKDELLVAIVEERVPRRLQELVDGIAERDPVARLEAIFHRSYALAVEHLNITLVFFRVGRELPLDLRDRLWESLNPITKDLFRTCRRGIETGRIWPGEPYHVGRVVADLLVGGIDELTQAADPAVALPSVLTVRLDFLRRALRACGPATNGERFVE